MTSVEDPAGSSPPGPAAESDGPASAADGDGPASAARMAAADAMRRLGHAIVAHEVGDPTFARITAEIEGLLAAVEAAPDRLRDPVDMTQHVFVAPPHDGRRRSHFPDCMVTGAANPLGMAADAVRAGDEAVLRATLGAAFEGAPGRAHGGAVAALLDEVMGFVLSIHATPAYTGRLTVTYRAPTPLGVELELRARLHSRHGRKLRIEARAHARDTLLAEGDGVFIAVDPHRFAAG